MNRIANVGFAVAMALLVSGGFANAQKARAKPQMDKGFMLAAAQSGMAEVAMGQLAAQKGSNAAVKQFGQHMVDDHSKANDELKGLAQTKGVTLPANLSNKNKALLSKLQRLNGAAFDRTYMADMVKDHQEDVAEFKKESMKGRDADVKSWAGKTLPTLEQHLQMAMSARKEVIAGHKK